MFYSLLNFVYLTTNFGKSTFVLHFQFIEFDFSFSFSQAKEFGRDRLFQFKNEKLAESKNCPKVSYVA